MHYNFTSHCKHNSKLMNSRLILFDIDETMIYSDGVGRRAMEAALNRVFERKIDATGHPMSGKTDPQICHEILLALGYSKEEVDSKLPDAFNIYIELLEAEICKANGFRLHNGVKELLQELSTRTDCHLGLLTGNIEKGARLKLTPFELNSYFVFGAFGCDSADRLHLPQFAHRRAEEVFGRKFEKDELVIIGDAVNDILCAQGYGIRCIITATGRTPKETLAELNPDYLFDSLENTGEIIDAIFASRSQEPKIGAKQI